MRPLLCLIAAATLMSGSALAADRLAPPPATTVTTPTFAGYGEIGGGWMDSNFLEDGATVLTASIYGNLNFGSWLNLQAELRHWQSDGSDPIDTANPKETGGFAHLYWRDPMRGAVGIFGGRSELGLFSMTGQMWTGGAEAQGYFGAFTLYGQGAYFSSTTSSGWLDFDGYFLRGTARVYATPNFLLQADAMWTAIDNFDRDTGAITLIGSAEYRFNQTPFSAFGRVRWDRMEVDPGSTATSTQFLLGIRAYFGTPTLLDNERRGAPFDVIPFPPTFPLNLG